MTEESKSELIFPVEKSQSGCNSYYQFCEHRQQQVSYAVCLHTIKANEESRLGKDRFVECQRAMCHDTCPARVMRDEEREANRSLYFVPRRESVTSAVKPEQAKDEGNKSTGKYNLNNESYARGWAQVGSKLNGEMKPRPKAPPPKAQPKSLFVEATMADVINQMVKEDKAKPKPQPVATTPAPAVDPLKPLPGETPLEFVRRRNQLKAAVK